MSVILISVLFSLVIGGFVIEAFIHGKNLSIINIIIGWLLMSVCLFPFFIFMIQLNVYVYKMVDWLINVTSNTDIKNSVLNIW
jgi:hypothetical protein